MFKKIKNKLNQTKTNISKKIWGDLYDDKKTKAVILLLLWAIFIGLVFTYIRVYNSNLPKYTDINELFNNIIDTEYSYNIDVYNKDNTDVISYQETIKDNKITGIKKAPGSTLNYYITDDICYNSDTNEVINDLYEDFLSYFFRIENIYNYIKDATPEVATRNGIRTYKYQGSYNNDNLTFLVISSYTSIKSIYFSYQNINYTINLN
jgi:hypothetical protein